MSYRDAITGITAIGTILVVIILLLGIMYVNYEALGSRVSSIESSWSSYTSKNSVTQGQVTKGSPQIRHITLIAEPKTIEIANNVFYNAWTFNGTVPGPAIFANQGDTIVFKLINNDPEMKHSIDFHAAEIDWSTAYASIAPGETKTFNFTANYPGVFMYHCGTTPVLQHIGNGMYGAIIVRSSQLPEAQGGEFVIVQSEFYLSSRPDQNGVYSGNYTKMLNGEPDYVVFNGKAFQYQSNPLQVKPNELVRLYILNAGPNHWSAFHVIGTIFDTVYIDGNPSNIQHGLQTLSIPPSGGAIVDMYFRDPGGKNPFVTHDFADASKGAVGVFQVAGGTSTTTTKTTEAQQGSSVPVSILPGSGIDTNSPGYGPATVKVVIGVNNTVIWRNNDNVPHTVTSTNGLFDSGNMNPGDTFSLTFNKPGTYAYYCIYHPWMKGTVIVLAQLGH